ncbi:MAG: fumarylacetoacetate hydrolase family protein [Devosia sp.]|nr:fumarylacetoacetate hydrolase family protein [Devosia sp.]
MPADYVIAPPEPVVVPVRGGGRFPVRRIFCVGRNYAEHAREMGHEPGREPPFFFMKPADAIVTDGAEVPYPPLTAELHHEIELVVALGQGGADIPVAAALAHIFGYAVGLDLTRRDLQQAARKAGRPWDMGKGFDHSAPIGEIAPATAIGHPQDAAIELAVNGEVRQSASIADMTWSVPEIVAELSRYVELKPGDLIFTGTPAGVSALQRGDRLEGSVAGVGTVSARIA